MAATRPVANVMREEVLMLGPGHDLVGVKCQPRESRRQPPWLFLNAGVLHRIGPHRLHVVVARRLAAAGIASVRIDLGGIGDSPGRSEVATFRESAVADCRAAMTDLASDLGERFVLFGLCSGADNALATAAADPRVVGLVVIDPPSYATNLARVRRLTARLREFDRPSDAVRWGVRAVRRRWRRRPATGSADPPASGREFPSRDEYGVQLTRLVERGVHILAIYSAAQGQNYNHRDQLFELYPHLRGRIDREYFPTCNHMFTEVAAQAALCDAVSAWCQRQFP
jgi:Alpha/beta hydrolase family